MILCSLQGLNSKSPDVSCLNKCVWVWVWVCINMHWFPDSMHCKSLFQKFLRRIHGRRDAFFRTRKPLFQIILQSRLLSWSTTSTLSEQELCFAFPLVKNTMVVFKIKESMCPKGEFKSPLFPKLELLWDFGNKIFLTFGNSIQNSKTLQTNLVRSQEICTFLQTVFSRKLFPPSTYTINRSLALKWRWCTLFYPSHI